jgi:hypothetical protein
VVFSFQHAAEGQNASPTANLFQTLAHKSSDRVSSVKPRNVAGRKNIFDDAGKFR